MGENESASVDAPKWVYDDVIPAVGSRVRSLHLLKQNGMKKSVLLFTEEAALVAEKGPLSGVKVYRVVYPRGLLLNQSNCPHCGKIIQEPVAKVARLARGAKPSKKTEGAGPAASLLGRRVEDIEGVGPRYGKRLGKLGIRTLGDLRTSNPDEIAGKIGAPQESVREWLGMAQLIDLKGIGPQYAELLARSGVKSIRQLREADPGKLWARIERLTKQRKVRIQGAPVSRKVVQKWVRIAQRHST